MNEIGRNMASRGKRLGGVLIDMLASTALTVPLMLATGVMQQTFFEQQMTVGQQAAFFVAGWIIFLALNGYLLSKKGQTIGKVVVKTRIVDINGDVPNLGKLFVLRYLVPALVVQLPIVGGIAGFANALFIFGAERRCVHDYIAGTWVVDA